LFVLCRLVFAVAFPLYVQDYIQDLPDGFNNGQASALDGLFRLFSVSFNVRITKA